VQFKALLLPLKYTHPFVSQQVTTSIESRINIKIKRNAAFSSKASASDMDVSKQ
jgi:hypothetical protein